MAKKTNNKDTSNKQKKPNIKTKGKASDLDVCIGNNLRLRRNLARLSQEKLGDAVNITFQQIQKNENGTNRVAASSLYEFSHILKCNINDFFDGYDGIYKSKAVKLLHTIPLDVLPLIQSVSNIKDEKRRKKVIKAINELILQNTE